LKTRRSIQARETRETRHKPSFRKEELPRPPGSIGMKCPVYTRISDYPYETLATYAYAL
jgi:hypothetical protein